MIPKKILGATASAPSSLTLFWAKK